MGRSCFSPGYRAGEESKDGGATAWFEVYKQQPANSVMSYSAFTTQATWRAQKRCEGCVCSTPGPAVWSVRLWATLALLLSAREPAVKEGEVITYKELKGT